MKKIDILLLLTCLVAMTACAPQPKTKAEKASADLPTALADSLETLFAVPLASAQTDTARYDSLMRLYFQQVPVRAFTIRSADFLGAIGLPETTATPFTHVRIYLGMDSTLNFKLFLTPVVNAHLNPSDISAGRDTILSISPAQEIQFGVRQSTPYMFDFSAPCPTTCPETNG